MVTQKSKLQERQINLPANKLLFRAFTNSKKAKTLSYERMLISKSRYLSLFNVFLFLDEIFCHFRKSHRLRTLRTFTDQEPHTVIGTLGLAFFQ